MNSDNIEVMEVQLLHNKACTFYKKVMDVLEEVLAEKGLPVRYEVILISDDEEAKQYKFFGSPQIMVDGKDIDQNAQKIINYHADGCRVYLYQGQTHDAPPKEMIIEALENIK